MHLSHVIPSFWYRIEHCPILSKFLVPEKSDTRMHGTRSKFLVRVYMTVTGTFVLKNFHSQERKFYVRNFRSRERNRHGTFALGIERAYVVRRNSARNRLLEWSLFCDLLLVALPIPETIGSWKGLQLKVTGKTSRKWRTN